MSITSQVTRIVYDGNGATTSFPTTFPFFEGSDIEVRVRDKTTNVVTLLTNPSEYSVLGGSGSTGSIEMVATYTSNDEITIERVTEKVQESDYSDAAALDLSLLERDFDKVVMRILEAARDIGRSIQFPADDDDTLVATLPNAAARANTFVKFDADGNVSVTNEVELTPGSISVGAPGQALLPLSTFAAWRSALGVFAQGPGVVVVLGGDTLANRPTPATFGVGIFWAIDTGQFYYSNASTWFELGGAPRYALASLPASSAANAGKLYVDTTRFYLHVDDGSSVARLKAPLPRGHLAGLKISNNGTDADNDIDVSVGACRVGVAANPDQDDAYLASALTKRMDATWAEGTNAGGMADGVTKSADSPYHIFAILNPDDGSVDVIGDSSVTAANVLLDAAVSAAGYTKFRRLGTIWTRAGSANILPFQQDGDIFTWLDGSELSFSATGQNYTTATNVALKHVPPGVRVQAILTATLRSLGAGEEVLLRSAGAAIAGTPALNAAPLANLHSSSELEQLALVTNTSRQVQVKVKSDTSIELYMLVDHYIDHRGRYE